jgi:predicted acylesterase/phospholipase RssA
MSDRRPLRITMTFPGAASLGAFQAGAAAAISVVVHSLRRQGREVRIDAVGGASAGSIVAMLLCHCLLSGRDAPTLLHSAWVDEVDIDLLRGGGAHAPLAFDDLQERLRSFLEEPSEKPNDAARHEPLSTGITFDVALTSLLGFSSRVVEAGGRNSTLTYVDWRRYQLEPNGGMSQLLEPPGGSLLEAVLVSASHPGAFAPRTLGRNPASASHEQRPLTNVDGDGRSWYTDGGLIGTHPIGRILEAARDRADGTPATRLHLVVDPRSSGPSGNESWADPDASKTWIDGMRRALSVLPTQALHDDIRSIATVNERLDRLDAAVDDLAERLGDAGEAVDRGALREQLAPIGGLTGKERVDVEMISPLMEVTGGERGVNDLLAGDFIGAFGGFLDRSIRASDFALGWRSVATWAPDALRRHRVDPSEIEQLGADLELADAGDWTGDLMDGDAVDRLDWSDRWKIGVLGVEIARVVASEAIPSPRRLVSGWKQR